MSYTPPPPPPPPGEGMEPGGYGYRPPQTNQKALWSMIVGIVSLVGCGVIAGLVAIFLGRQAKKEIAASNGMQGGGGMATAGIVTGAIGLTVNLVLLVLFITTGAFDAPNAAGR